MKYAGFWLQIAAGLLNMVCLSVMLIVLCGGVLFCVSLMLDLSWAGLQEFMAERGWGWVLRRFLELVFVSVVTWFYLYVVYHRHASLGQMTFHLRVVMMDGSAITVRALMLRKMVFLSLCATYVLGMLVAGVTGYMSQPIVSGFTLFLLLAWTAANCIVMLSNARSRSIEEMMAGTVVIKVQTTS